MIELSPELLQRIEAHVATGTYKEPNEVVQAALDVLDTLNLRKSEYAQLTTAIEQVDRCEYEVLDIEDVKKRGRDRIG